MDLRRSWINKLKATDPDIRLLVTIGIGRRSEIRLNTHPGTWGRVIRASTHESTNVLDEEGKKYPYWPTLVEWPEIRFSYSQNERRVDSVSTSIRLLSLAGYVEEFFKKDYPQNAWVQIDLWMPGIPLEQSLTLFGGPITEVSYETDLSTVTLSAEDRYDGIPLEFPTDKEYLDTDDFPRLQEIMVGKAPRNFIYGPMEYAVPVYPIDETLREFYVCEPPLQSAPTDVWVGAQQLKRGRYRFRNGTFETSGAKYTKLILNDRVEGLGYTGQVYVRGGSGPDNISPLRIFLSYQPGLLLTERAAGYLSDLDRRMVFDYYVLINQRARIEEIIMNKLIPQTDLVSFYRNGRLDLIQQHGLTRVHDLRLHSQLKFRVPTGDPDTGDQNVYNAIDIKYRRNYQPYTGKYSRYAVLIDKNYGGDLAQFLLRSEALYGRRYLSVDASDLGEARDAERLGISMVRAMAFSHRNFVYNMDYRHGLYLDINDRARLTDPEVGLSGLNCRVTQMQFTPTGINVGFQSTDDVYTF